MAERQDLEDWDFIFVDLDLRQRRLVEDLD